MSVKPVSELSPPFENNLLVQMSFVELPVVLSLF